MFRLINKLFNGQADERSARQQVHGLADAEARMRSVVDHVIDGIITIDERGVITTFNPAAEKIFGYTQQEVIAQNVKMLMPEPDHSRHDGYIANYLRTGEAKIIGIGREVRGRRKTGSVFPMELAISEFRLGAQRYFTGIVRDITERKHLEQELHRRLKELAEADQRKDQFIALLGHELRNPLAPIRNGLEILRRSETANATLSSVVDMMGRQVTQMVRLIDDLLDVSRITSGKIELRRETVDLIPTVQHALDSLRAEIEGKDQALAVELPSGPVYVDADPVRIAQIVANLVNNASKYSQEGATITVSVGREGEEGLICVRDNGTGIPPEKLDAIFDIFVQIERSAERRQGGLGLGLTLVKSLVELHGGTVKAQSSGLGMGSEFTVRLPLLTERRGRSAPEQRHMPFERRRVLVIDDNIDSADSLSSLLRMMGHEVATLYNGEAAVEQVARFEPDVVLCDIRMPGMSGLDVAKQLRRVFKHRQLTLIAATGYGRPEDAIEAKAAGFDDHLVKPVDLSRLSAAIHDSPKAVSHAG